MKLSNLVVGLVVMASLASCESTTKVKNPSYVTNAVSKKEEVVVVTSSETKAPEVTPVVKKEISALELCQSAFTEESSEILASKTEKDKFIQNMERIFLSDENLESKSCETLVKKINEENIFFFRDFKSRKELPAKWVETIIRELKNAQTISLTYVTLENLDSIFKMTDLMDLQLEKMDIKSLKGLDQLQNLLILRLDNINLQNESLDYLPKVSNRALGTYSLYLNNNKSLTDISKLIDYANVISILGLKNNDNIKDFRPISKMKKLFALMLRSTDITDSDLHDMELEKLKRLYTLELSGNKQISNLDFLSELKSLNTLYLEDMNSDLDLKTLTKAPALKEVHISKSQSTSELIEYLTLAGITVVAE